MSKVLAARVKGLSEPEFREWFGTEAQCRAFLIELRWGEGFACPQCGHRGHARMQKRKLMQCNRCKHQVGFTAGTVFHSTKLPLTTWFLAIYHLVQAKGGISSVELGRRLGVKQQTAWSMKQKLMRAMAEEEEGKPPLRERVEIDDAYLGGRRSGGKRGRGAAGKLPFVAMAETSRDRRPRRIRLAPVKGFRKREVKKLANSHIAAGTNVVSDGLSCWQAVEAAGCRHFPMRTGSGRKAAQWTPFNWVNTSLGNIKTAIAGTYHHISAKHAPAYLASFAWRFNRRYHLDSLVERLLRAGLNTAPKPYRLIVSG